MINFCGIAGVLFAFVGLVLIAVSGSLPNFVDIFLIQFESQVDDSEAIGGIGVFTSFYDPTTQDPAVIAVSGVPDEEINADTLEFPLLFPAEFNFVEDILPVDAELAGALQVVTDDAIEAQTIIDLIDPILALDAEELGCTDYATQLVVNVNALSVELHDPVVFPEVMNAITSEFGDSFLSGVFATQNILAGDPFAADPTLGGNFVFQVVAGTLALILAGFPTTLGCEAIVGTSTLDDATALGCLQAGFAGAATAATDAGNVITADLLTGVGSVLLSECNTLSSSINDCINLVPDYQLNDVSYEAVATFLNDGEVTACDLFNTRCDDGTTIKSDYNALLAGLLGENDDSDDEATAAQLALLLQGAGVTVALTALQIIDVTDNTANNLNALGVQFATLNNAAPTNFDDNFDACLFVQTLAAALGTPLGDVQGNAQTCTISEFFPATAAALAAVGNANAGLFALISGLYGVCEEGVEAENGDAGPLAGCPDVFTAVIVSGGFAGSVDPASDNLITAAADECEDDIVDSEKVAQAQASLITSFVFYGLNVIVSPFAFLVRSYAPLVYGFSAASALFAGLATLTALLIVRSAPVYQGVGEGINEDIDENDAAAAAAAPFEIFFTEGVVALIAFLDTILMFVTSGCFIGAVVIECMCQDDDFDEEEEDEKKDEDVGSPAAAAEDDYKVVAANGEEVGI